MFRFQQDKNNIFNSNHLDMEFVMARSAKNYQKMPENFTISNVSGQTISDNARQKKNKMGFASNTVNLKMSGKTDKPISKAPEQDHENTSEYLVISTEPGQGGFKKKKS